MSLLARVHRGRTPKPPRILLYGPEGIGKTTFGSQAPKPIFVPTEDGQDEIDCAKFLLAATLDEVLAAITDLRSQPHDYETVVIDSLDWLERLIWDKLCGQYGVSSIEKVDGGPTGCTGC
ncbi:MAG: ATP-binding protein [Gemmataceae bacterium]|nr:ATP-binding protein [Gemmataceae bacterium]